MAGYSVDQLYAKLERADAAGDTEAAKAIADEIRKMQGAQQADFSNVQSGKPTTVSGSKPATYNLTGVPGVSTQIGGFLDAAQHHVLNIPHGIAQGVEHAVNAAANAFLPAPEQTVGGLVSGQRPQARGLARVRQYINDTVASDDAALRQREADYQERTAGNAGSYLGAALGEVAPWMVGIGELRAMGLLPKVAKGEGILGKSAEIAKKGGLLAAEGGVMGLVQPVTGEGSYGRQKAEQVGVGAVAAPVIGALGKTVGAGVGGVREAFSPGSRLARLYGLTEGDIATLRNANSGVPGVPLTVAQALQTPEAVQAERVLRNRGASAPIFSRADSAANRAMMDVANGIAGTPADIAAAKQARTAATAPYFGSMAGQNVPYRGILDRIESLSKTGLGQGAKVQTALGKLRSAIETQANEHGSIDADVLKGIRENFRSYFDGHPTGKELKALEPIADEIAGVIESQVPGYRASVAAFRDLSRPINDMEAGQQLVAAISRGGRDASGNQAVHLSKLEALLAKNARGKFPMTPSTRAKIEALAEAQRMRSVSNNTIAASGPGTAADAGRGLAGKILPTVLSAGAGSFGGVPGFLAGLSAAGGYHLADSAATRGLARLASNSQLSADAIEALMRQRANPFQLQASPTTALLPYQQ